MYPCTAEYIKMPNIIPVQIRDFIYFNKFRGYKINTVDPGNIVDPEQLASNEAR